MSPQTKSRPAATRCTMCGKGDVVPTLQRRWWDWFFKQSEKYPFVCRACGWRFYVKKPS